MEALDEKLLSDKAPIFRVAYKMLKSAMLDILYGRCDEYEVADIISRINPERNGYFRQEDFVNSDEAMIILRLGKNRTKFFELIKKYKIESQKISNMNVGYLRKDIIKLKYIITKD